MKIDMSPEAVTKRLKTMEQLWELSVNLMQAKEISETPLLSENSPEKDSDDLCGNKTRSPLADASPVK